MKKIFLILLLLIFINGCGKVEPFSLSKEYYDNDSIVNLSSKEFNGLVADKKSFIVFIYMSGCTSCSEFDEVLKTFVKNNEVGINAISFMDIKDTILESKIKYAPSVAIIKDGKIVQFLDAEDDNDLEYYENEKNFTKWLNYYIILTN